MKKAALLFLILMVLAGCQYSSGMKKLTIVERADVVEYGIYNMTAQGAQPQEGQPAPNYKEAQGPTLITKTDVIPAVLGTSFGFKFKIAGSPSGSELVVTVKNYYPSLQKPGSEEIIREQQYQYKYKIRETGYVGYTLEQDWELAQGDWKFQIYYEDKLLVEKSFIVYKP